MDVTSLFPSTWLQPTPKPLHWEYRVLHDIEILGDSVDRFARLILEDDEGGEMVVITCSSRDFRHLEPYAADLQAWKSDPYAQENPVIPVAYSAAGQLHFCTAGVEHDYPELTKRSVSVKLPSDLAHQIRKAAKAHGMTRAELVMSALLKSATKFG